MEVMMSAATPISTVWRGTRRNVRNIVAAHALPGVHAELRRPASVNVPTAAAINMACRMRTIPRLSGASVHVQTLRGPHHVTIVG
jgi:hypothetical protein